MKRMILELKIEICDKMLVVLDTLKRGWKEFLIHVGYLPVKEVFGGAVLGFANSKDRFGLRKMKLEQVI